MGGSGDLGLDGLAIIVNDKLVFSVEHVRLSKEAIPEARSRVHPYTGKDVSSLLKCRHRHLYIWREKFL